MIVYIILRKISEWSLSTFYSDVHVDSSENVPKDGPLLVHSKMRQPPQRTYRYCYPYGYDSYRRQISFWAKASSFKNPISGFILGSSGAIPVHRNPNNLRDASTAGALRGPTNESLFLATSRALAGLRPRGGLLNRLVGMFPDRVIGIFPEGTSYTEPCIVQVKEGAAWVALEYGRWMRERGDRDGQTIKIIPVGIAYTDKTQYLSRVYVHYGEPLVLTDLEDEYCSAIEANDNQTTRAIAAELTTRLAKEIHRLSINAPNWSVLHSAEISRRILWTDKEVPLEDFVVITNALITLFSSTPSTVDSDLQNRTISSLLAYSGLLYYTKLRHESLSAVIPRTHLPSTMSAMGAFFSQLLRAVLYPKFIFFLPH
ncbi:hypothetical protein BGW80DRAFT_99181 [Lactifluus volemus]|nr:hypothetical protein BGW80DRAFT_99181 [Lactifluus volemus]